MMQGDGRDGEHLLSKVVRGSLPDYDDGGGEQLVEFYNDGEEMPPPDNLALVRLRIVRAPSLPRSIWPSDVVYSG
jgi:hypothetical protein